MTLATEPIKQAPPAAPEPARTELAALASAAVIFVGWMIWISASGGYHPSVWYPSALAALSLAVAALILGNDRLPRVRAARVALLAFLALVALNYLSILWAGSRGTALDASNLLLLYAAVAWIFSVLRWTPRMLTTLLGLWAVGVATFCAIALIEAASARNLSPFFVDARFATPMHYPNATAALAVMGMWPAVLLSARRELPAWLRAAFLAVGVFLAEFAFLPQSRAALVGLIVTVGVALVCSSDRLRLFVRMLVVAGGVAICIPRTVTVEHTIDAGHPVMPALHHAAAGMLLTTLVALALGVILAGVETMWSRRDAATGRSAAVAATGLHRRPGRRLGQRGRVAVVSVVLAALAGGAVAAAPTIVHAAKTVVKKGRSDASTGSARLLSTTPEERFDYARVALRLWRENPILGVGAGNFGPHYDALRQFPKHSPYTHDISLRALSETGIIGLALLVTVICALAVGLVRTMELGGLGRACAVAALTMTAYFVVHDSLDWMDQFPALATPAFCFAMAAIGLREPDAPVQSIAWARPARWAGWVLAAGVLLGLWVALAAPYLSKRYVADAFATFKAQPTAALDDLRRADKLNPLSADPLTAEGTIYLALDEPFLAQAAFERSIRREDAWYPRLELALIAAEAGRFADASRKINAAAALDADDPVIAEAKAEIKQRKQIDPVVFNRLLLQGVQSQFFQRTEIR